MPTVSPYYKTKLGPNPFYTMDGSPYQLQYGFKKSLFKT